jgi:hypothetical protein
MNDRRNRTNQAPTLSRAEMNVLQKILKKHGH